MKSSKSGLINVSLPNFDGKKGFRYFKNICRRRKINLDLKIYNENVLDITVPFKKRTDVLIDWFQYYDTITQKWETIEFYDYYDHL